MHGYARVCVAIPAGNVVSPDVAAQSTLALWRQAHHDEAQVVTFPELGLSSYSARDLLFDATLLERSLAALAFLVEASRTLRPMAIVGLPLATERGLYNTAAVVQAGRVLGVVPKSFVPTYREFEERRWFRPGVEVASGATARVLGADVPFGTDLLFEAGEVPGLIVGVEICEDVWVQIPPSMLQTSAGATVVCNLSASNFTIGKAELRRMLCLSASDRGKCAYLYGAAGPGESSTDLAFDADGFVCENGRLLAESKRFARENQLLTVDVDLEALRHDRMVTGTFGDCAAATAPMKGFRRVPFTAHPTTGLQRDVPAHPFLPSDPKTLSTRCWEIFEIQTNALATRAQAIGTPKLVLGVSGGLDSTMAALVCATALDLLGRKRSDLVFVTMPGFGTSQGTKSNALSLCAALGATTSEISIAEAARVVLSSIGHPAAASASTVDEMMAAVRADPRLGDPALENVQARMRTLVLMSIANRVGGLVVGTGDLSEKALGWSTYAGDHISMYDVNAGVPKTLIQFVIRWVANERVTTWASGDPKSLRETLFAILDTPISPELLPLDAEGKIAHLTEEKIGPYELHDFFLFHFVRHGRKPSSILDLAAIAFAGSEGDPSEAGRLARAARYDDATLRKWCRVFFTRFFHHQFKRSCTADAPKVGQVALSPRGDWRMPSDASPKAWLDDVDRWRA